jgi:chromosome segregation ATPase
LTPTEAITLISSVGALLGVIGKWALDLYRESNSATEREAARIAARDKTQAENGEWLRATVDDLIRDERAERDRERAECTSRLDGMQEQIEERDGAIDRLTQEVRRLRDALSDVPRLVETLGHLVSRLDPYRTPTPAEMDRIREAATALGLSPQAANGIVIGRTGA